MTLKELKEETEKLINQYGDDKKITLRMTDDENFDTYLFKDNEYKIETSFKNNSLIAVIKCIPLA